MVALESNGDDEVEALERFVVENDDLLELETHIGRFNVFDALCIERAEIRHSNFLSWLLDPNETHGQGAIFLTEVLKDLFRRAPKSLRPFSPVLLDGEHLAKVDVRREWQSIDLLIVCTDPNFVIAIENKVDSGEHDDQLNRYKLIVDKEFPSTPRLFVFLTIDGDRPSEYDWIDYSYADIHRVLTRAKKMYETSIGDDVMVFLDHYLRMIGSRFMNDRNIDELCRRIYQNHRQAIKLIVDRIASPYVPILDAIEGHLKADPDKWHVFNRTNARVDFVPQEWRKWLPPIADRYGDLQLWLVLLAVVDRKGCRLQFVAWNTTNSKFRNELLSRITAPDASFQLNKIGPNDRSKTNTLCTLKVMNWQEDEIPEDSQRVVDAFSRSIEKIERQLAGFDEFVRPILQASGLGAPSATN